MALNVGDKVKLKSGGPKMTVTQVYPEGRVECTWFDGGTVQTANLPENALEDSDAADRRRPQVRTARVIR